MATVKDQQSEQNSLQPQLKLSLILHVAVFLVFSVKAIIFPDKIDPLQEAIRVDMVALPDKIDPNPLAGLPEPAPVAEPEKSKDMPKKEPKQKAPDIKIEAPKMKSPSKDPTAINLEKSKEKQKQALDKLKQQDALERLQKQMEQESKQKAAQAASSVKIKGNVISPGTELTGINQLQADNYRGDVLKHMKKYWEIPQYIKKHDLATWVLVKFDQGGNILSKNVVKTSGNPAFDEVVLKAIENSSPVPAPPGKFAAIASVEGFLFRFSPEQ